MTTADLDLNRILENAIDIQFNVGNPHRTGTKSLDLFEAIKGCRTIADARAIGATLWNLKEYYKSGALSILSFKLSMHGSRGSVLTKKEPISP